MVTNEGEPLHTITIHDNETGGQRTHHTDDWAAAYAFARKMRRRYNGSKVTITDPSGHTITIRENGWSRVNA